MNLLTTRIPRPKKLPWLALAVLSCGPASDDTTDPTLPDIAETTDTLLGSWTTSTVNNCGAQTENVQRMMKYGRVAVRSAAFEQCIEAAMSGTVAHDIDPNISYGPYKPCLPEGAAGAWPAADQIWDPAWDYPLPAQIARALTATQALVPTSQTCNGGLATPGNNSGTHTGLVGGVATWNWNAFDSNPPLNAPPVGQISLFKYAGEAWHEGMHDFGYQHGGGGAPPAEARANCGYGPNDYNVGNNTNSAPTIVSWCIKSVLQRSADTANPGCGIVNDDLKSCGVDGFKLVSRYEPPVNTGSGWSIPTVNCHCVQDVSAANESGDYFGFALAVGDFDDDGYDDLAVGAPGENASSGVVFIYRGSSVGLRFWRLIWPGHVGAVSEPGDQFGRSLAVGDFNGDGADDLAIGTPYENAGAGVAVVVPGCNSGTACADGENGLQTARAETIDQTAFGANEAGDHFAWSLAAGDLNGDGRDDLAVGVPNEEVGGAASDSGYVMTFKGLPAGPTSSDRVAPFAGLSQTLLSGQVAEASDLFGYTLTFINLDGAGASDLAIGAPGENSNDGTVHIASCTSSGSCSLLYDLGNGVTSGGQFGRALAAANFRGDAGEDLAIGAPGVGKVYTAAGNASFGFLSGMVAVGHTGETGDGFGAAIATYQWFGAAYADLLIGAPYAKNGTTYQVGAVFPALGHSTTIQTMNQLSREIDSYTGPAGCPTSAEPGSHVTPWPKTQCPFDNMTYTSLSHENLGLAVAGGDFDGDSVGEAIGAAPFDTIETASSGGFYVLAGSTRRARFDQATVIYGMWK